MAKKYTTADDALTFLQRRNIRVIGKLIPNDGQLSNASCGAVSYLTKEHGFTLDRVRPRKDK